MENLKNYNPVQCVIVFKYIKDIVNSYFITLETVSSVALFSLVTYFREGCSVAYLQTNQDLHIHTYIHTYAAQVKRPLALF